MCLLKMEQRVTGLSGQLFNSGMILSEFYVGKEEGEQMLEKVQPITEIEESCIAPKKEVLEKKSGEEEVLYKDLLVGATQATKDVFDGCKMLAARFRETTAYKILTRTTQPSHAISMMFVSFIMLVLWPNIVGQRSSSGGDQPTVVALPTDAANCVTKQQTLNPNVFISLAYFGSFAMHFGAQMWMTFVSGLALYFNLPRHTFGRIQEILFPKYFSMGSALSVVTLLAFIKLQQTAHPELTSAALRSWDPMVLLQLICLGFCTGLELVVWLYLAPPMLRLMHQKYNYEATETVGQEVGHFSGTDNPQLQRSLHYKSVHKRFRQIHMATAMANMAALLCTFVHLHYMASRVQLL